MSEKPAPLAPVLLALAAALLLAGLLGAAATRILDDPVHAHGVLPEEAVEAREVSAEGLRFEPAAIRVRAGDVVTWRNDDATAHDVTQDAGGFRSPLLAPGGSWTFTFTQPGTYAYHCHLHPEMSGLVVVE